MEQKTTQMSVIPAIVRDVGILASISWTWLKEHAIPVAARAVGGMGVSCLAAWGTATFFPELSYAQFFFILSLALFAVCVYRADCYQKRWALFQESGHEKTNLLIAFTATGALTICTFLGAIGSMTYEYSKMQKESITGQTNNPVENSEKPKREKPNSKSDKADKGVEEVIPDGKPEFVSNASAPVSAKPISIQASDEIAEGMNEDRAGYIGRFTPLIRNESLKFGIPASIIAAQAIIESRSGASKLAISANNHFGVKRKGNAPYVEAYDDEWQWNEKGKLKYAAQMTSPHKGAYRVPSKFRKYNSAWESFRDHSLLLKENNRYAPCFKYGPLKYKEWANALQKCGYCTKPTYAKELIQLIETHKLYKLDSDL